MGTRTREKKGRKMPPSHTTGLFPYHHTTNTQPFLIGKKKKKSVLVFKLKKNYKNPGTTAFAAFEIASPLVFLPKPWAGGFETFGCKGDVRKITSFSTENERKLELSYSKSKRFLRRVNG